MPSGQRGRFGVLRRGFVPHCPHGPQLPSAIQPVRRVGMVSQSNTPRNVPETVLGGHMIANGKRPVQEQPVITDTPDIAYAHGK
ncbi:MAG: hypothetical protein QOH91_968 [Mycobacterium sp.]|nr:hypothetical protein [Mycobacterium sp.]